ncbi:hypothetical protein BOTBODRAFT_177809 [Botryobasidium botryosum FD-172 SS1]|uniref:Uncharacterized protein n=1 Tax=Botryobasidium botryosum (strain FD-172 SS1) TaxID=930990 RepID=A0A067MHA3_BOTB1|nr:hypothetical protein BOTBODRAFT_177809 [Botryobasidium botryosum FD-172 SS1]
MHGLAYSSCQAHPFINNDHPAPTKHPRVRFLASPTTVLSIPALACHSMHTWYYGSPLGADERVKLAKHSVTSVHDPPVTQPCPRASMHDCRHPSCTGQSPIVTQSPHHNNRPSPIKHPTPKTVLLTDDLTAAATYTDARLPANNQPRPTQHPTMCANASSIVIVSTGPPFGPNESPKASNRPLPTKHPTVAPLTMPITSRHSPSFGDDHSVLTRHPLTMPTIRLLPSSDSPPTNDLPAPVKHPATRETTSSSLACKVVCLPYITDPSTIEPPPRLVDQPPPTKHPTTRSKPSSIITPPVSLMDDSQCLPGPWKALGNVIC